MEIFNFAVHPNTFYFSFSRFLFFRCIHITGLVFFLPYALVRLLICLLGHSPLYRILHLLGIFNLSRHITTINKGVLPFVYWWEVGGKNHPLVTYGTSRISSSWPTRIKMISLSGCSSCMNVTIQMSTCATEILALGGR